jgi:alkylation response protein AidB-like acyl-CoA dehydrogenase
METVIDLDAQVATLLDVVPPGRVSERAFWGEQFDRGLAWVTFPEGEGGLGLSPERQIELTDLLASAGAPNGLSRNGIGIRMAAPAIVTHGTLEQRARFLRKIFTCEEIWCQLFSEPNAGSDIAAISTSAIRQGNDWLINGHKVWSTLAHVANWGLLCARSNPQLSKHAGLSFFLVDMHSPGIEIRPIRQMTGNYEFNEVIFTNVRIPDEHLLGDEGLGWRVVITTLMNERLTGGTRDGEVRPIDRVMQLWLSGSRSSNCQMDRILQLWIASEAFRYTSLRARSNQLRSNPGPEGAVGKLATSELGQRSLQLALEILGAEGMLVSTYESTASNMIRQAANGPGSDLRSAFLFSPAMTIAGGTSEILRNTLAERTLGLPRG